MGSAAGAGGFAAAVPVAGFAAGGVAVALAEEPELAGAVVVVVAVLADELLASFFARSASSLRCCDFGSAANAIESARAAAARLSARATASSESAIATARAPAAIRAASAFFFACSALSIHHTPPTMAAMTTTVMIRPIA